MGKKKRKKRPDPLLTFCNALSFYEAAKKLDEPVDKTLLVWPMIACEAFSLELSLKCLHYLRRRTTPQSHDARKLFDRLSKSDRKRIQQRLNELLDDEYYISIQKGGVMLDIGSILVRASRMFVKIRYWHELELPDADASGDVHTAGINELNYSVLCTILEIRPDWTKSKLKSLGMVRFAGQNPPT